MKRKKRRIAEPLRRGESICWRCGRATGRCEWSALGRPVPGWQAEQRWKTRLHEGRPRPVLHAKVTQCPKFWDDSW